MLEKVLKREDCPRNIRQKFIETDAQANPRFEPRAVRCVVFSWLNKYEYSDVLFRMKGIV